MKGRRGLILFDGDNIEATARRQLHGRRVNFGRLAKALTSRFCIDPLVQATVFISAKFTDRDTLRFAIEEQGVNCSAHDIVNGHGYDDQLLAQQAIRMQKRYDVLVLVTSDNDFLETVEKLKHKGKKIVIVGYPQDSNAHWIEAFDDFLYLDDALDLAEGSVELIGNTA